MSGFNLNQQITYWLIASQEVSGGKTFDVGVLIDARTAVHVEQITTAEGKIETTKNAIYTRVNLPPGTYVLIGDAEGQAAPTPGAEEVLLSIEIPAVTDMSKALI